MAGTVNNCRTLSRASRLPPIESESESDNIFLESLSDYIQHEKERLQCPDKGPDEQRYIIYSSAFDKVIEYATAYKSVLTDIKKEYDDFIGAVKKSDRDSKLLRGKLKAMVALPTSLMYCQRRAVQLQERIAIIQRDTAELRAELKRLQETKRDRKLSLHPNTSDNIAHRPVGQIPGLTFDESMNPASLAKHLDHLMRKKADLHSKRKSQYVSMQVKADLDNKMKTALDHRDELSSENERLQLRSKQLKSLSDALNSWEKKGREAPLTELLATQLETIRSLKVMEADYPVLSSVSFEEDDPTKVNETELLVEYIERFLDLFEGGEYDAAAFHAAKSPHGVLRNMETMERFKSVTVYQGEMPPLLQYFQALTVSATTAKQLPGETLSLEGVCCALKHNFTELVTHWVTQRRLTYSEPLGDLICEHGEKTLHVADTCLALAHIVYAACGTLRKAALALCKRGMVYGAMEFIHQCAEFTAGDCLYVVRNCPSMPLLQLLTQDSEGQPALLTVGFACRSLLRTDQEDLGLQLLDKTHARGHVVLEKEVVEDRSCSAGDWAEIAARCSHRNRAQLSQEIMSILLSQSCAASPSPAREGTKLTKHAK